MGSSFPRKRVSQCSHWRASAYVGGPNLLTWYGIYHMVIDLNVRRNQPRCSNFAFKVRSSKNLRSSCRSRGERCLGANGNSSYIFSTVKYTVIIKYSTVWKWCRTFSANFFDPNVRHQACLRSNLRRTFRSITIKEEVL